MAQFLKLQDKYINVDHISYVSINQNNGKKLVTVFINDKDSALTFGLNKSLELSDDEIANVEAYLQSNMIIK